MLIKIEYIPDVRLLSKSEFHNELGDGLLSIIVGGENGFILIFEKLDVVLRKKMILHMCYMIKLISY